MEDRYARIMKLAENMLKSADGMNMGDYITASCIALELLCQHFGLEIREVAKDMYDEIVEVNDKADEFFKWIKAD